MLPLLLACSGSDSVPIDRTDTEVPIDSGTVDPGVAVMIEDPGAVTCVDPSQRDLARFDTSELRAEADKMAWFWGGGVIAGDFDADGFVDLILPGFWETQYFRGTADGAFVEDPSRLPAVELGAASGGSTADFDGDGDLDVLVLRFLARDRLLRNDGGVFVDVSEVAGLSTLPRRSMVSSWSDYDRDGDVDLFIGCYGFIDESGDDPDHATFEPAEPDFLYVNRGDGTFEDRSADLPQQVHDGYALAGGFHDLDVDGWPDLYVVNDFGASYPNHLLWNREGAFVSDNAASGLDVAVTGMGVGFGDANGDGRDDLVMTAWDGNAVLMSGTAGAWFDYSNIVGITNDLSRQQKIAWGTEFVDIDNDGDLDVPMTYGFLDARYPSSELQPDALYVQGDDGHFVDQGVEYGLNHPTIGRGFVATDLNGDGTLDLVKRDLGGPTLVHISRCGSAAWLTLRLRQPGANTFAIGARVEVFAADRVFSRTVHAGGTNHASGGPPELHFGLDDLTQVDRVVIHWPDGEVSRMFDVQTRRPLRITRL